MFLWYSYLIVHHGLDNHVWICGQVNTSVDVTGESCTFRHTICVRIFGFSVNRSDQYKSILFFYYLVIYLYGVLLLVFYYLYGSEF